MRSLLAAAFATLATPRLPKAGRSPSRPTSGFRASTARRHGERRLRRQPQHQRRPLEPRLRFHGRCGGLERPVGPRPRRHLQRLVRRPRLPDGRPAQPRLRVEPAHRRHALRRLPRCRHRSGARSTCWPAPATSTSASASASMPAPGPASRCRPDRAGPIPWSACAASTTSTSSGLEPSSPTLAASPATPRRGRRWAPSAIDWTTHGRSRAAGAAMSISKDLPAADLDIELTGPLDRPHLPLLMKPIVTTLNPSIDGASETLRVQPTHKIRTTGDRYDPGGGGINVARIVTAPTAALPVYPAGGATGNVLDELMSAALPFAASPLPAIPGSAIWPRDRHRPRVPLRPRGPGRPAGRMARNPDGDRGARLPTGWWSAAAGRPDCPTTASCRCSIAAASAVPGAWCSTAPASPAATVAVGGLALIKPSHGEFRAPWACRSTPRPDRRRRPRLRACRRTSLPSPWATRARCSPPKPPPSSAARPPSRQGARPARATASSAR